MNSDFKKVISTYFFDAQELASKYSKETVTMQFFQRNNNVVLSGMNEVLELLTPEIKKGKIQVNYLEEGSVISSLEVVLELIGKYEHISLYEGIIDGILSRGSSLATNARECVEAAKGIEIICMADRSDHYRNIDSDCWSYYVGGIRSFSAPNLENNKFYKRLNDSCREKISVYHSLPHGAIQIFKGDVIETMSKYNCLFPELPMIALVDFNNNVIKDSLDLFKRFGDTLKAVRVDTNPEIRDIYFDKLENKEEYKGVNPILIGKLREELDKVGGQKVKIYLSSGFNPERISQFISSGVKVEGFGVGQFLTKVDIFFTGDLVKLGNLNISKKGRKYRENKRLREYTI